MKIKTPYLIILRKFSILKEIQRTLSTNSVNNIGV